MILDKTIINNRFSKASNTYDENAIVQNIVAQKMANHIANTGLVKTKKVLEVGCGTGLLTKSVTQLLSIEELYINDISKEMLDVCHKAMAETTNTKMLIGDAEQIELPKECSLVMSTSTIQWFYDTRSFIKKMIDSTKIGGIIAISTFGKENFREMREITNKGLDYMDKKQIVEALEDYCDIHICEEEIIEQEFDNAKEVLEHIRRTGTNTTDKESIIKGKGDLEAIIKQYESKHTNSKGKVKLTYNPIYILATKKQDTSKGKIYFVSAIDTDAGKTYATGFLAKQWREEGINTITQKLIQTGNKDISEDIVKHREIMGIELTEEDKQGITMPEIYSYPCSPHLATKIDGREIDFAHIEHCTNTLRERYERVLLEGAGGLMVPLTEDYLTIDYIKDKGYSLIFVTSSKLGSINHTLLSLEAIKSRRIKLKMVIYNKYPRSEDQTIANDTEKYIRRYIAKHFSDTEFLVLPEL